VVKAKPPASSESDGSSGNDSDNDDDADDTGGQGEIAWLLSGRISRRRDNFTFALAKESPALEQVAVLARLCGLPDKGGIRQMHCFHYQERAGIDEDSVGPGGFKLDDLPVSFTRQLYLMNSLNDFDIRDSVELLVGEGRTHFIGGEYKRCPEYGSMVTAALACRVACEPTYETMVRHPNPRGVMGEPLVFPMTIGSYSKNEQSMRASVGIFESDSPIHFYRLPRIRCTDPRAHGVKSRDESKGPDEDDVVLARAVDDFDGALTEDHAERVIAYLCEPHVRIPMLLQFMAQEGSGSLFSQEVRHLLWHAVFEGLATPENDGDEGKSSIGAPGSISVSGPGAAAGGDSLAAATQDRTAELTALVHRSLAVAHGSAVPASFPVDERDGPSLATPWGPLMHEIAAAPAAVLVPAKRLVRQIAHLCENNADKAHVTVFFFCIRLVARIECFARAVLGLPEGHACAPPCGLRGAVEHLTGDLRSALEDTCSPVFAFFMSDAVSRRDDSFRSAVFGHQLIAWTGCPMGDLDSITVGRLIGAATAFGNWHTPGQQVLHTLRLPARLHAISATMKRANVGGLDVRDAEPHYMRQGIYAAEGDVFEALHGLVPRMLAWLELASASDRHEALTIALRVVLEDDQADFQLAKGVGLDGEDAALVAL